MDSLERARSEYIVELEERTEQLEQLVRDYGETLDFCDQRIEQLKQLCRDLWLCAHEPKCCNCPKYQGEDTNCEVLNAQRMDALGLLEGDAE